MGWLWLDEKAEILQSFICSYVFSCTLLFTNPNTLSLAMYCIHDQVRYYPKRGRKIGPHCYKSSSTAAFREVQLSPRPSEGQEVGLASEGLKSIFKVSGSHVQRKRHTVVQHHVVA